MVVYVLRRLGWAALTMVVASVVVFAVVRASTDPSGALRGPGIRAEDVERYRDQMGLDQGAVGQYRTWIAGLVRGDLGESLTTRRDVWPDLRDAMWNTAQLGLAALVVTVVAGVGLGTLTALRPGSWFDRVVVALTTVGLSVPAFLVGLALQIVLVLKLQAWFGWTPFYTSRMNSAGVDGFGLDRLRHMVLPVCSVAVQGTAVYCRYMRASLVEVLAADHVRAARARGVGETRVVLRHGVRNALVPLTTVAALDVGAVMGGLVVTEQVFEWPGMARYFLVALGDGDVTRLLPWVMVVVAAVVVANLVADLLYGVLDPRARVG